MTRSLTRIAPDLIPCWEDLSTLRFGFEHVVARLHDPTRAAQRMISALITGVRSDRLSATLTKLGVSRSDWEQLTTELDPVLTRVSIGAVATETVTAPLPEAECRVRFSGPESIRARAVPFFQRAGFELGQGPCGDGSASPPTRQLVVAFARFLARPAHAAHARDPDDARLTLRFGQQSIDIGPLTDRPGDPCAGCASLHDRDADPALPTLAAQLYHRIPASETPAASEFAMGIAVALLRRWLAGTEDVTAMRLRVRTRNGLPSVDVSADTVSTHPECGCALTRWAAAPPQR